MGELRDVDARDVVRVFEEIGGVARTGKGDHVNVKLPNGRIVTLSSSRGYVKIGALGAMLRKAGMTQAEFKERLGRRP